MRSLEAIADPTRRRIVEMLAERDRPVGELVHALGMTAPAISQHLKVLRSAGVVQSRAEGQTRIQSLNRHAFQDLSSWLARTLGFWQERLDLLEEQLGKESAESAAGEPAAFPASLDSPSSPAGQPAKKRPRKRSPRQAVKRGEL